MRHSQRTKCFVFLGLRFKFVLLSLMLLSLLFIINGESYAAATIAINSGGPAYVATDSTNYQADTFYSGGAIYGTGAPITGTTDPILFETLRWGNNFSYNIPVPNGTYTVTFKFAEIFWNQPGKRSFNVFVQGVEAITGLDVFNSAGGQNKAYDVPIPNVSVTGGNLNINFQTVTDNAIVSAIEVVPVSPKPLAGASGYVLSDGTVNFQTGKFSVTMLDGTGRYEIDPLCTDGTQSCFTLGQPPAVCICSVANANEHDINGNYVNNSLVCQIEPQFCSSCVGYQTVVISNVVDNPAVNIFYRNADVSAPFQFTCGQ